MKEKERILEGANVGLAVVLNELNIRKLRLIGLGNSISAGYARANITKPLLIRNESIESIMKWANIGLERYNYSRSQNNNDDHIFEWLVSNIKQSEINRLNRSDYEEGKTNMPTFGLDENTIEKYYPLEIKKDMGLADLLNKEEKKTATAVIYNGATGSFLDNITRDGKLTEKLTYGIKRDITGIEATLKYINTMNRKNNTNTQVYLCGAPNYLGLNITGIINLKLKRLTDNYANVTYVKPVKSKFIYKKHDNTGILPDVHYDEDEYIDFNINIMEELKDSYKNKDKIISIDRDLYDTSKSLETINKSHIHDDEYIISLISEVLMNNKITDVKTYQKLRKYLLNREPYDFYYLGKKNINKSINEQIKILEKNNLHR